MHFKIDDVEELPKQVYLSRQGGRFFISFSYKKSGTVWSEAERLAHFDSLPVEVRADSVLGIDLGVKVPVATSNNQQIGFDNFEIQRLTQQKKRQRQYQRNTLGFRLEELLRNAKLKVAKIMRKPRGNWPRSAPNSAIFVITCVIVRASS